MNENSILNSFLCTLLYNTRFTEGFGTLYTAVYKPSENLMQLHWPNKFIEQTFDNFHEADHLINYSQLSTMSTDHQIINQHEFQHRIMPNDITPLIDLKRSRGYNKLRLK